MLTIVVPVSRLLWYNAHNCCKINEEEEEGYQAWRVIFRPPARASLITNSFTVFLSGRYVDFPGSGYVFPLRILTQEIQIRKRQFFALCNILVFSWFFWLLILDVDFFLHGSIILSNSVFRFSLTVMDPDPNSNCVAVSGKTCRQKKYLLILLENMWHFDRTALR